jgi:benzoylformate decarboxylase
LIGDTKAGLAELDAMIAARMTGPHRERAAKRTKELAEKHAAQRDELRRAIEAQRNQRPLTPLVAMESLARVLPPDVAIVEEAVTTTNTTIERLGALKNTDGYFGHRGWALGWGLGVSIGAKLAWPRRPVLAILGEGAALYGIQGLWTAARYRIPVTFVICNNAQYQILKIGARGLHLPASLQGQYVGLDLADPEIDMVALAKSLGVEARRIAEPDDLSAAVAESFRRDRPLLIDVPIRRETPQRLEYG